MIYASGSTAQLTTTNFTKTKPYTNTKFRRFPQRCISNRPDLPSPSSPSNSNRSSRVLRYFWDFNRAVNPGSYHWLNPISTTPLDTKNQLHQPRKPNFPQSKQGRNRKKRGFLQTKPLDHEFLIGGEWLTLAEPREPQFTPEDFHLTESQPIYNSTDTTLLSTTIEISDFNPLPNDVILIVVKTDACRGDIETSLWNNQTQIDWRSTKIADYQTAGFHYALHTIKLADIPNWNPQTLLRIRISSASHCLIGKYLEILISMAFSHKKSPEKFPGLLSHSHTAKCKNLLKTRRVNHCKYAV